MAIKNQVLKLADRIRLALEKTCVSFLSTYDTDFKKGVITASFGIAKNQKQYIKDLIEEADKALYKAKAKGKKMHSIFSKLTIITYWTDIRSGIDDK